MQVFTAFSVVLFSFILISGLAAVRSIAEHGLPIHIVNGPTIQQSVGEDKFRSENRLARVGEKLVFPDASIAGVPPNTPLKPYEGPQHISVAGTVIDGQIINDTLRVTASDVTIRNSVITFNAPWGIDAEGAKNITIRDSVIIGPGYAGDSNSAILGSGNFIGNDISKVQNGITLTGGASTVAGNYIHDLESAGTDPHYDGISVQGGQDDVLIHGNTIVGRDTSDIFINNDFGPVSSVMVSNNLLIGDAGYPMHIYGGKNGHATKGVEVVGNHIAVGGYGYFSIEGTNVTFSGNVKYERVKAPSPGDAVVVGSDTQPQ